MLLVDLNIILGIMYLFTIAALAKIVVLQFLYLSSFCLIFSISFVQVSLSSFVELSVYVIPYSLSRSIIVIGVSYVVLPVHLPSPIIFDFPALIFPPLPLPKSVNVSMTVLISFSVCSKNFVSSAYAMIFLAVVFGSDNPFIQLSCLILSSIGSILRIYNIGDSGQPCLTDFFICMALVTVLFIRR